MRLIKSKYEIIEQSNGLEGIYKNIELAGKVSHKSEGNIKEGSAKTFVDNMIKLGHNATLEFGAVYLFYSMNCDKFDYHHVEKYHNNPYSKVRIAFEDNGQPIHYNNGYYITTNMRVLVENNWLDDLKYMCEPTEYHDKRYCVKFTCDRGILAEFTRHRSMSFMAESTRFCNYSNGRFNKEITYIIPSWCNDIPEDNYWVDSEGNICCNSHSEIQYKNVSDTRGYFYFLKSLINDENYYFTLLDQQWQPQQARQVLPNALKTELYMCGFTEDWKHFFSLRSPKYGAKGVHPDAAYLADMVYDEFIKRNYINE